MSKPKRFNREQRLKIYKRALETFIKMAGEDGHREHVTGMCKHISKAVRFLRLNRNGTYSTCMERKNYPEYFSYKPKTGWADERGRQTGYWWSTKTPRGRERRIKVLRAIAEGKDKSITGPLP